MRKSYGNTWWGKQWLNALNQIDYSNRLPRGRRYANNGSVLEVEIDGNQIRAAVQGSRPRPYSVDLTIPPFSASEKAKLLEIITSNPLFLSQLLNRELPEGLYGAALKQGIHLFPRQWGDLSGGCSCPDWAVPCKHMAAVLYLVANEIDKNPFLVFDLHRFDLFQGLAGIGYTAAVEQAVQIPAVSSTRGLAASMAVPAAASWDESVLEEVDLSQVPDCLDQIFTLLKEQPVFFPTGDFKKVMATVYKKIRRSMTRLRKQADTQTIPPKVWLVEQAELVLANEGTFWQCELWDAQGDRIAYFEDEEELMDLLRAIPLGQVGALAPDLGSLVLCYHLAEKLLLQCAYVPQLFEVGETEYWIRWQAATFNGAVGRLFNTIKSLIPADLVRFDTDEAAEKPYPSEVLPTLMGFFLSHFIHTYHDMDLDQQLSTVTRLFFKDTTEVFDSFEEREYPGAIQVWLSRFYIAEKDFVPVLQVEDKNGVFVIRLSIDDKSKPMEAPLPLRALFEDDAYAKMRLDVLKDLALMTEYFPQLSEVVGALGKQDLRFDAAAFVPVLFDILPIMRLFGIKVLLPKALKKLLRPQLSMELEGEDDGKVALSSIISLENMLRFNWQVAIGDQLLQPGEFQKLVKQLSGIVKLNDEYVYFDEKEIKQLIQQLDDPPAVDQYELLQVALTEEYNGAKVRLDKRAQRLMKRLLKGEGVEVPEGLKATLRPYQLRGYEWLVKNARLGFGSLIADDMGLGKTLQVIATLLKFKEAGDLGEKKALIIVPTTLLTNWQKEIQKFAPTLTIHPYHGSKRSLAPLATADALITTYGVVRSETSILQKQKWLAVVIDEAQNIKNPTTAQTKAVKKMKASVRIAMSGTPVENRLSEYWSIFDFSNKKYLGSLAKFKENFAKPIELERDQRQLERFRKITSPFILRRLKSDRSIIQDLPDKIEQDQFCELSPEQAALYQNVVDTTMKQVEEAEGINRRGLILKLITALKQVCNHPAHFLKKGDVHTNLSGKTKLLIPLLRQTLDSGEKSLIFTQYQTMGNLLAQLLEAEFGIKPPFLHGGVSRKGRDAMVSDFQENRSTRIMLLSLKAGGTGLNLTAASNVIHYDLWWNPAVEAQATDRAYRIGQERNVLVHRFITQGTFEEKINKMLQSKKELANLTVSTGEKWIGELSNSELQSLIRLD